MCIAVGAGASGAVNMWYDRDIDSVMERTMNRPLPAGRLKPPVALWLGTTLSLVSVGVMGVWVNLMSAGLLAVTIAFYVFVYTIWLKRRTPQNIVIGAHLARYLHDWLGRRDQRYQHWLSHPIRHHFHVDPLTSGHFLYTDPGTTRKRECP